MESNAYIEAIFKSKCFGDLHQFYPNAKEWTESYGTFKALHKIKDFSDLRQNEAVRCVCPGDGVSPRTAGLVACMTKWTCYSVDPMNRGKNLHIKRLFEVPERIEEFKLWGEGQEECPFVETIVVLQTHSHAKLDLFLPKFAKQCNRLIMVALECCVKQEINIPGTGCLITPKWEYEDERILSPKNRIKIWDIPSKVLK